MPSWGSFAWGFGAGLFVGELTLVFFLAAVRKDRTITESPPLAVDAADKEPVAPVTSVRA